MSNLDPNLYIGQQAVNKTQAELITQKILKENILQEQVQNASNALNNASDKNNQLKKDAENWREKANIAGKKVKNLEEEVIFYKNLLAKPMIEIANKNENFKETYKIQQEFLASWMVSQKSFKELAINFGIQLGKTKEDVIQEGTENRNLVLNNKTKHGNDVGGSEIITPNIVEALKHKMKST